MTEIDPNTSFDEAVPKDSKWLQRTDVNGEAGRNLIIASFHREQIDHNNPKDIQVTVHWQDDAKPMVLKFTNKERLKSIFGENLNDAIGQPVNVYLDPNVDFGGKLVGGLRIRKASDTPEDQIPF